MNHFNLKGILALPLILMTFIATAQKLPEVQPAGVWAPENIKIDGDANEWNNKFQAYNKTAGIYYTLSNNEDHLFLTVQAADPDMINKLVAGGLAFTIQKSGKKNDKDAMRIIYPYFTKKNRPYFNIKAEQEYSALLKDSVAKADNKQLDYLMKTISVSNISGVDTLVTVNNENDIKVAETINNKLVYTWELSLSLKQLGLSQAGVSKFAYHISIGDLVIKSLERKAQVNYDTDVSGYNNAAAVPTYDFWGGYTLAKK
jgi:hypothetical protein